MATEDWLEGFVAAVLQTKDEIKYLVPYFAKDGRRYEEWVYEREVQIVRTMAVDTPVATPPVHSGAEMVPGVVLPRVSEHVNADGMLKLEDYIAAALKPLEERIGRIEAEG